MDLLSFNDFCNNNKIIYLLEEITFGNLIRQWKFYEWVNSHPKYKYFFWDFKDAFQYYKPNLIRFNMLNNTVFNLNDFDYSNVKRINRNIFDIYLNTSVETICINFENFGSLFIRNDTISNVIYDDKNLIINLKSSVGLREDLKTIGLIEDNYLKAIDPNEASKLYKENEFFKKKRFYNYNKISSFD